MHPSPANTQYFKAAGDRWNLFLCLMNVRHQSIRTTKKKLVHARKTPATRAAGCGRVNALLVGIAVVSGNAEANARDGVRLYLSRPLAVDRLRQLDARGVERQIGDIDPVAAAHEARGKQQPDGRAVAHAVEIAQLGDGLSGLVGHHDLVRL